MNIFEDQVKKFAMEAKIASEDAEGGVSKALAALQMTAVCISSGIEEMCKTDEEMKEAIKLEHKSFKRMMRYIMKKAKECAYNVDKYPVACIPSPFVFGWVREYYLLDDKAEVEAEIKAAEEERELEEKAEEQALKELEDDDAYIEAEEEEQASMLTRRKQEILKKLKADIAKAKKKAEKGTTAKKGSKKKKAEVPENESNSELEINEQSAQSEASEADMPTESEDVAEPDPESASENNTANVKEAVAELDEQISIFDFLG